MPWQQVRLGAVKGRAPSLYLDESVDAFVQQLLRALKMRVESAAQAGLLGHDDPDHFAYCWRRRKVLVTFDFDFLDYKNSNLSDTRNPGVIVLDCDTRKRDQVVRAVSYVPRMAEVVGGREWRHTRSVVGPTGNVRIRRRNANTGAHEVERYRFRADDRLEHWIVR
jgi:hypothetical protein